MDQTDDPMADLIGSRVAFARRWRVIDEIDLVRLIADHSMTDRLCDQLERCADRLPDWPSDAEAERICKALETLVLGDVGREERLLAAMFGRDLAEPLCHTLIESIHMRHAGCVVQAQDLTAMLKAATACKPVISSETFGYMLRCFFEGRRSAMAFGELSILTLGADRLTVAARAALVARLTTAPG